jgi:hypothetical protein
MMNFQAHVTTDVTTIASRIIVGFVPVPVIALPTAVAARHSMSRDLWRNSSRGRARGTAETPA